MAGKSNCTTYQCNAGTVMATCIRRRASSDAMTCRYCICLCNAPGTTFSTEKISEVKAKTSRNEFSMGSRPAGSPVAQCMMSAGHTTPHAEQIFSFAREHPFSLFSALFSFNEQPAAIPAVTLLRNSPERKINAYHHRHRPRQMYLVPRTITDTQLIEFDIAVTASHSEGGTSSVGGGFKLSVLSAAVGGGTSRDEQHSSASRLKFQIPLKIPFADNR